MLRSTEAIFFQSPGFQKQTQDTKKNPQEIGVEEKEYDTPFLLSKKRCDTYGETATLCWLVQMDHRAFTEPKTPVPDIALKLSGALFRNRQTDVDVDCLAMCPQGTLLAGYFPVELYGLCKVLNLCLPVSYSLPWFIHTLWMVLAL